MLAINIKNKKTDNKYLSATLINIGTRDKEWHSRLIKNLKKNWLVLPKMAWRIWQFFTRALESLKIGAMMGFFCPKLKMHELEIYRDLQNQALENLKNLHFNGLPLTKVYVSAKKVLRSYVWWHWILIQNLKGYWLALSKVTWGIWQIFVHKLKNNDFILESKMAELNQNKNQNNQIDQMQCEDFILSWK